MTQILIPQLFDCDWLFDKHVTQLYSQKEIAVLLNVHTSTVVRALKRYSIKSPSQQSLREASNRRRYGVANPGSVPEFRQKALDTMTSKFGGHVWANAGSRQDRDQTCLAKYGDKNVGRIPEFINKMRSTKIKSLKLNDRKWLTTEYVVSNKSISQISNDLNCGWSSVKSALTYHNIPIKQSSLSYQTVDLLSSVDWLTCQVLEHLSTQQEIADKLGCGVSVVSTRCAALNLEPPLEAKSLRKVAHRDQLSPRDWLLNNIFGLERDFVDISRELGVSTGTVKRWCEIFDVDISLYKYSKYPVAVVNKLNDKKWLEKQHGCLKKPQLQIATELGLCNNTPTNSGQISRAFKRLGINVIQHKSSIAEREIASFVAEFSLIQPNIKNIIHPYEIDIYIPSHRLAIEYCGLYWHSEGSGKGRSYHQNKMVACNNQNIRLITIFEDEWIHSKDLVKEKLRSILGLSTTPKISARQCDIRTVSKKLKKQFFDAHHIQGDGPGSITYGLFYTDELVSAMTFIKTTNNEYYLNRYATSCVVRGGFSRLVKHFTTRQQWSTIISFADLRWSEGRVYQNNKFALESILPPDYSYISKDRRIHKFNYRRKHLPKLLNTFDPLLSEWENCKANGVDRIWDCGKHRYVLVNTS